MYHCLKWIDWDIVPIGPTIGVTGLLSTLENYEREGNLAVFVEVKLLLWLIILGLFPKDAIKLEEGGGVKSIGGDGREIFTGWIGTWTTGTGGGVTLTTGVTWITAEFWGIGYWGWKAIGDWTIGGLIIGAGTIGVWGLDIKCVWAKGGGCWETGITDEVILGGIGFILWIGAKTGSPFLVDSNIWEFRGIILVVGTSAELIASIIDDWLGWKEPVALGLLSGAKVNCLGGFWFV